MTLAPPRVALLAPYWSFFEASVPFDLRADRVALLDAVAELLGAGGVEVLARELVEDRAAARAAAARIAAAQPDALVLVQSMAVPPAFALAALGALPELPLVVLAATRRARFDAQLDHAAITSEGATVGVPQLTNVLHRRGRAHALTVLALDAADDGAATALAASVRAAAAAGRLQRARIARVGRPIDGYDCVDCDADALRTATGIALVDVPPADVRAAYLAADPARAAALADEARATFALADDVEADECLARSVRFAAALEALDARLDVDAGAMNCHVPEIRFASDEPGITPCYALGRETSRGIPWSCAGDVVTAVALLAAKLLGGAALYHEIEALDHASGEALLANSGEHDIAFADPDARPQLVRNRWWAADPRCGACACFGPPAGPATLIAFTPHAGERSGFRFVVA
ncbi:MAG TPA: hypothetical protein VFS37_15665, partial [Conexibacter sp.]|nr:hypothetical protein [Conexibacter sp.]